MIYRLASLSLVCSFAFVTYESQAQSVRIVASASSSPAPHGVILRETVDPCLGVHWEWVADPDHPDWPYRLVEVAADSSSVSNVSGARAATPRLLSHNSVIRAGELITIYQQTGALNARLQALALESAAAGRTLRVRLTVNADRSLGMNSLLSSYGPVVTVTARGPGEAVWLTAPERSAAGEQIQ